MGMGMIGSYFCADANMLARLEREDCAEIFYDEANERLLLDVDKAWHIIHYVLNGTVWDIPEDQPLGQLVLGGEVFVDEDMGYGPPRLLGPETVRQMAEALEPWDKTAFRTRFHVKEMAEKEIYPICDDEDEETCFEYAWSYFELLSAFVRGAAEQGSSLLLFIS